MFLHGEGVIDDATGTVFPNKSSSDSSTLPENSSYIRSKQSLKEHFMYLANEEQKNKEKDTKYQKSHQAAL